MSMAGCWPFWQTTVLGLVYKVVLSLLYYTTEFLYHLLKYDSSLLNNKAYLPLLG